MSCNDPIIPSPQLPSTVCNACRPQGESYKDTYITNYYTQTAGLLCCFASVKTMETIAF